MYNEISKRLLNGSVISSLRISTRSLEHQNPVYHAIRQVSHASSLIVVEISSRADKITLSNIVMPKLHLFLRLSRRKSCFPCFKCAFARETHKQYTKRH